MRRKIATLCTVLCAGAGGFAGLGTVPADAQVSQSAAARGTTASFEGREIDLAKGWQEAQSCVVSSPSSTTCYRSNDEADAALNYDKDRDVAVAAALPACADGWFCIYEHINGGGRRLIFRDNYWQDLYAYGFAHQASSARNRQPGNDNGCLDGDGSHSGAPCWSSPSYVSNLGVYNDWAIWVMG